jgi:amidase
MRVPSLLVKTNLSEWANFRSTTCSGWSSRGGQTKNPYILDHNPCGSMQDLLWQLQQIFAWVLGTETDGSVVCPSSKWYCRY